MEYMLANFDRDTLYAPLEPAETHNVLQPPAAENLTVPAREASHRPLGMAIGERVMSANEVTPHHPALQGVVRSFEVR